MLKYVNTMVTFSEVPDEISLCIEISNCPCHCKGCHSEFLWEDKGFSLTTEELDKLIEKNDGITTVCFMGGDSEPQTIQDLAEYVHEVKHLKVGWYSGRDSYCKNINFNYFDYIKLGHYDEELGGLNKKTTNQRLYKLTHTKLNDAERKIDFEDITSKFWK